MSAPAPKLIPFARRVLALAALLALLGSGTAASAQEPPRPADEPLRVGEGITRPEKISGAAPVYTELARRARVSGTVITEAIIDEQGDVVNVRVLKGLPMGLDQAAVDAVKTWKFKPATVEGRPVKVYYVLTVNFHVENSPPLGPLLQRFLKDNPEFVTHLSARRFAEAAGLLDRLAADDQGKDPAIAIARCHLLLKQGLLDEAWAQARSERGLAAYEMLYLVGVTAHERASQGGVLSREARADLVDLGLQAETMALEIRSDGLEAMLLKLQLLVNKFELTSDPAERAELQREAIELRQRAMELHARQQKDVGKEP
jgi:TonB family protein